MNGSDGTVGGLPTLNSADFFVETLPGLNAEEMGKVVMHAGMITINETIQAKVFFWLVEAQIPAPERKLLIWLNGGPGCSSLNGMFLENGPLRLSPDSLSLSINPHSWHHGSSVLYVDQPVGTGFSSVLNYKWNTKLTETTEMFVTFLERFLDTFPQLRKAKIYLGGESFAGVYIPYFSKALITRNEDPKTEKRRRFKIAGAIIESGWMDPMRQYSSFIDFGVQNKILGEPHLSYAKNDLEKCIGSLKKDGAERVRTQPCERIMDSILDFSTIDSKFCINMYDVRLRDSDHHQGCGLYGWPEGVKPLKAYLSREDVQKALHALPPAHSARRAVWEECNQVVFDSLMLDESLPSYTGATLMNWVVNGSSVGTYQTARNLTNVVTFDASHSPGVDHPLLTLDVFNRLLGIKDPVTNFTGIVIEPFGPGPKPTTPVKQGEISNGGATSLQPAPPAFITPTVLILFLFLGAGFLMFLHIKTSGFRRWDWVRNGFSKIASIGRRRVSVVEGVGAGAVRGFRRRGSGFSEFEMEGGQWHELSQADEDEEDEDGTADRADQPLDASEIPPRNARPRRGNGR
ncbi:Cell death protease [Dinochytrium kinnereticum]|nr:Cell death protease [Dinochytrium kinnereticum]